jgi:hypothetical protein
VQKSYMCSNDVSIQYAYYEVGEANCLSQFNEFIYYHPQYYATIDAAQAQIPVGVPGFSIASYTYICPSDSQIQYPYYGIEINIPVACQSELITFVNSYSSVPPYEDGRPFRNYNDGINFLLTSPLLAGVRAQYPNYTSLYSLPAIQRLCPYGGQDAATLIYYRLTWLGVA